MKDLLRKVILEVARKENILLMTQFNKGIFHMPELAFAYECGKQLTLELKKLHENVDWQREYYYDQGGPTDLAFVVDDQLYLIEFKMDDTDQKYVRDFEKLTIPVTNSDHPIGGKFFCGLKWCLNEKQADEFTASLKSKSESLQVDIIAVQTIETIAGERKNQICLVLVAEVQS